MALKKKLAAGALAGAMALAMAVPAFAEDPAFAVKGTYSGEGSTDAVISVGYTAPKDNELKFVYKVGENKGKWNPATHTYDAGTSTSGGKWEAEGLDEIAVTNHSNVAIKVSFGWKSNAGFEGVKVGVSGVGSDGTATIETAEDTAVANAPKKTFTIGMTQDSGGIAEGTTDANMGTLTLHVDKA